MEDKQASGEQPGRFLVIRSAERGSGLPAYYRADSEEEAASVARGFASIGYACQVISIDEEFARA